MNGPFHSATVVRTGALGDFLLTLPLLRALAERVPTITLITRGAYRELLPDNLRSVHLIDLDTPRALPLFAPSPSHAQGARDLLAMSWVCAFTRPDPELTDWWTACGAQRIDWLDPRPDRPPHVVAQWLDALGFPAPALPMDPQWPRPSTPGNALWCHPGSGSPQKNAPLQWFVQQVNRLGNGRGQPVIASFGEADLALVDPITVAMEAAGHTVIPLILPKLGNLRERLRTEARHFVGNDSGVTHLAAALGIPLTVWFSTTDPKIWHPLGAWQSPQPS